MKRFALGVCLVLTACSSTDGHTHEPVGPAVIAPKCRSVEPRIVDLTQLVHEAMPVWPGGVAFKMNRLSDYEQGYRLHEFHLGENSGTHVDAPAHFVEGKRTIDQIPVSELVVALVVIDVRKKAAANPDYAISANDLVDWEAQHGTLDPGTLVVANTGWHARFRDPKKYLNQDDAGVMHFPGFAADAARLLVERDVTGIGIDTLSLDPGPSTSFDVHKVMLGADKLQIENLANLDKLPPVGATVIIGVWPVKEGSQAPARVIALVPPEEEKEED